MKAAVRWPSLKAAAPSEHAEQADVVRWFRAEYPSVRIFAIPNGGLRSRATAARLKAEGVSAGVPDLFVPAHLLWVEMKRAAGGRISKDQADWREYLVAECGHSWIVCHGADDAKAQIARFIKGEQDAK